MDKLNFAIIGCGRIASRHAEIIKKYAALKAVCDINKSRADEFNSKYDTNVYYDMHELLMNEKDVNIVSICTPNGLHAEQTIRALYAGMHVICEKPMAISSADCRKMINAAEETGKNLFIVKQNRFNPPIAELKKLIDNNILGRIINFEVNCFWNRNDEYYKNSEWKGKQKLDGGTLYTQFSHFIDLMYWLCGDVKNVKAYTKNFFHNGIIDFEDTGVVILEMENGALATINFTVNSYNRNMEGSITIFAERGTVKVGGQYLNVLEYQNIENYEITGLPESRPANDYGFYQGSMSNHDKVYENVMDVLLYNGKIAATGEEGLKTVEIIEKIYEEAKIRRQKAEIRRQKD
jgi:predicted dehydrogenase